MGYNATDVTGSCTCVIFNGKKILLECGLHQEADPFKSYKANSEKFPFKPDEIDYVFICHAHIDHIGLLPRLVKEGFKGKIILNEKTAMVADALLRNCAFILGDEARTISRRYKRDYSPIYTEDDVERTLDFFYLYYGYNESFDLDDVVSFEWLKNAHCLGATQLYLTLNGSNRVRRILYTSDLGSFHTNNHYVEDTEKCSRFADYVIMESTYGDNKRISKKTRDFDVNYLKTAVNTVLERKGTVVMPAFSFSRTQELLTTLYDIFHKDDNFKAQIIVDSKLSCQINSIYSKALSGADLSLWNKVIGWDKVRMIKESEKSMECVADHTPKIVLSSSGFCTNGRIVKYLQEYLKDTNSMIIFSGFVGDSPDYLSYRIKNYKTNKTININKKPIPNRADCTTLSTFSSHANHKELVEYGSDLNTNMLILVHGSKEAKEILAKELKEKISKNDKTYKVRISERDMMLRL